MSPGTLFYVGICFFVNLFAGKGTYVCSKNKFIFQPISLFGSPAWKQQENKKNKELKLNLEFTVFGKYLLLPCD